MIQNLKNSIQFSSIIPIIASILLATSCKPPQLVEDELPSNISGAFIVLNEGLFQHNNSSLTWFHWHTQQNVSEMFEKKNAIGMGDTGNDLAIYGNKIYILMNNSHIVHVLDRKTGKLQTQISLAENGIGASPRNMTFHHGKVYVSAFNDFLYKIDTTTFGIEGKIQLGKNPDQMLLVENELWVSNSGGLVPEGDSTISVVDLLSFSEINRVTIGRNPGAMTTDGVYIYGVSRGNYVDIPSRLVKINKANKVVEKNEEIPLSSVRVFNNKLYASGYYFESNSSSVTEIDKVSFEALSENLINHLSIQTLYGFQQLEVLGQEIFAFLDAKQFIHQGKVIITDHTFQPIFEFSAGLNPTKIIFNAP